MKAAIYCRLSEEDRGKLQEAEESGSIQNQKAMLLQYAMEQGWEVADIYSDDDYAGADRRRPEFNRLLRDAKARKFDIILCKTQSRFTRELELVEKYIHGLFPQWGIRFISIVDNADTENKGNKKSRQINGLVNEWYLEDLSENIRSVLNNRRENGHHIGSFALYGYRKDPAQKGHLIIDEAAAAVVRQVFTLYAQGYGKTAIARLLNDRGIPNPTEYKRRQGLRYRQPQGQLSTLWKYSAIAAMLRNEIYIGNLVQGKYGSVSYKTKQNKPRPKEQWYVAEGTHAPIIDRALWDQVQQLLSQRARPFAGGQLGLFAGIARCAHCGYTLRSAKSRGRHYLQCPNRYVSADVCPGAFISVERLEQMVLRELNRLTEHYLDRDELERQVIFYDVAGAQRRQLHQAAAECLRSVQEYDRAIGALYLDKVRGLLTEGDYRQMARDFSAQRDKTQQRLAQIHAQLAAMEKGPDRQQQIEQYIHPQRLSRQLLLGMVERIEIGRRLSGTRQVPVRVHWRF